MKQRVEHMETFNAILDGVQRPCRLTPKERGHSESDEQVEEFAA